ncbi:MAG: hypothetical protein BXU00_02275 [Candidatus Nanoclepta minutus]|uniref:Type II secretion system protein GspF domain-containing protein n=1 Tax=Candidatus Nanoclepta minutus TaxID=1940235 RepID=A0A397WN41_9ARCH|nr:MAG: hypothetical protein BXU00_02275 [Candidatus Nanoclepta minutus]
MRLFTRKKDIADDPEVYGKIYIFGKPIKHDRFILIISLSLAIILFFSGVYFKLYMSYITLSALLISVYSIVSFPYIFYKILENNERRRIEDEYISFLRDLAEALSSGMSLHQALKHVSEIGYTALGKFIRKLYVWVSWGIDFRRAFEMFNKYFEGYREIRRANNVILETYISGGDLAKILKTLSDDLENIRDLEKLRASYMRQQTLVMYIIYVVFIGMLIGILTMLKPMMMQLVQTGEGGFGVSFGKIDYGMLKNVLGISIIVEAFSIAIINGYIESNRISGSFRHLAITTFIAVLVYIFFIIPPSVMIDITMPIAPFSGMPIEMTIKVGVDMKPITTTARIEVLGPSTYLIDYVDVVSGAGRYTFTPSSSGKYTIKVTVNYGGNRYTEVKEITVS